MTRQALTLRDHLGEYVSCSVLAQYVNPAEERLIGILKSVATEAGLTFAQYCELEAAANAALGEVGDAAFVCGLLAGQDPLSLILRPAAGDQVGELDTAKGGNHARR